MTLTHLGTLGGKRSSATAINDLGHVLGSSRLRGDGWLPCKQNSFLWKEGTLQDLGQAFGWALNNLDQIAGIMWVGFDFPSAMQPRFWVDNEIYDLLPPGATFGSASAINDRGQIVGQISTVTREGETEKVDGHVCVWQDGTISYLTIPTEYAYGSAHAINNWGQVVGMLQPPPPAQPSLSRSAALWEEEKVTVLNLPPGFNNTCALAINAQGQILVEAFVILPEELSNEQNPGDFVLKKRAGFLWDAGRTTPLLAGDSGVYPRGLNDHGQVVGELWLPDASTAAFLWQNGEVTNLNTVIPADSGWVLTTAADINNQGQIVGTGEYNGKTYAYLLTPV